MLRYELTPNNAGFILWGDSEALNELHELIHYIVDESPLIKVKRRILCYPLPMIFVKHGKVIVVLSNISMINMIHISFMVLSFAASVLVQSSIPETQWVIFRQTKPAVCHVCL